MDDDRPTLTANSHGDNILCNRLQSNVHKAHHDRPEGCQRLPLPDTYSYILIQT